MDADNNPYDLTDETIRMNVYETDENLPTFSKETGGSGITIGGTNNNEVTVSYDEDDTALPLSLRYVLWRIDGEDGSGDEDEVLSTGLFTIKDAVKAVS
jgi:hypothetical protein